MLTTAQLSVIKAAILAETNAAVVAARAAGDMGILATFYNAASAVTVWRTYTSGDVIRNAIVWANMTPNMAPDGTTLWTQRSYYSAAKQLSLQTLVQGQSQIASGMVNVRVGLQDCLTALPTGSTGQNIAAGWTAVQTAMQRQATVGEALFINTGTGAAPWDLVWEGVLGVNDLSNALNGA
jgi:hypothetical protein